MSRAVQVAPASRTRPEPVGDTAARIVSTSEARARMFFVRHEPAAQKTALYVVIYAVGLLAFEIVRAIAHWDRWRWIVQ